MLATQKGRSNPMRISCKRSEKLKSGSLTTRFTGSASVKAAKTVALHSDPYAHFFSRKSGHTNHFVASGLAGGNGNGRSWHLQKFREEFDAGFISSAFHGRRG
jgi:hypothetical protein